MLLKCADHYPAILHDLLYRSALILLSYIIYVNENFGSASEWTFSFSCVLFQFLVNVQDLGNPSRPGTNTATVTVTVRRNLNCATLTNLPAEITINETETGVIFTAQYVDLDDTVGDSSVFIV